MHLSGICGLVGQEYEKLLLRMCSIMHHRGPNASGVFNDNGIGLGYVGLNTRKQKIDRQPIHNEDGTLWVVLDGTINDHSKLRAELESKGHRFYTVSDAEVLVHLYEEHGDRFVSLLKGVFAFAIWDTKKRSLLLVRDRLGVKPVYYVETKDKFLFASEIKALLQSEDVMPAVNVSSLHDYLTFRHGLGNETMFEGIYKLLPGHKLVYSDTGFRIERYWDIPIANELGMDEEYYVEKLRSLLEGSTRECLCEGQIGVYLSGGIDSGLITGLASKFVDEPIESFSVGFGSDGEIGELSQAKEVADHFGTNHHEIIIEQGAFMKNLEKVIWHCDEPVADPSAIAIFTLSKTSERYVNIALNGAGGDEMFGGYISYKMGLMNHWYHRHVPGIIRKELICPFVSFVSPHLPSKMYVGLNSATHEITEHGFLFSRSVFSEGDKRALYTDKLNGIVDHDSFKKASTILFDKRADDLGNEQESLLSKMMYADARSYLVDHILLVADKLTMASSVEVKVPLIDHSVVEFAYSIPDALKLKGMTEKYILKRIAKDILPKQSQKRKKRPFRTPIDTWFKGELLEMAEQVMDNSTIVKEGYFKQDVISDIMKRHKNAELLYNHKLYSLLVFEMWSKTFIK